MLGALSVGRVVPLRPRDSSSIGYLLVDREVATEETGSHQTFWERTVHLVRSGSKTSAETFGKFRPFQPGSGRRGAQAAASRAKGLDPLNRMGSVLPFRTMGKGPHSGLLLADHHFASEDTGSVRFVRSGSKDSGAGHLPVEEDESDRQMTLDSVRRVLSCCSACSGKGTNSGTVDC
jgi:hypothetical protein